MIKNNSFYFLVAQLFLLPLSVVADELLTPVDEAAIENRRADQSWLDSTHRYVYGSTDNLASWIDNFFGDPQFETESAYSSLRLRFDNEWQEGEGDSHDVRLRGKVHLPRINKRLSLVFTDLEGDEEVNDDLVPLEKNDDDKTNVGLQYKAREEKRSRLDFGIGLRSKLKFKANARYRYQKPMGEKYLHRFTETLYFIDGDGFGSRTRYDLDRRVDENRLLRWSNNFKFAEDTNGVAWSTRYLLAQRIDDKSAITYSTWISGETRPSNLAKSFGLGVRYRRSFLRPWLFYELEPGYAWIRTDKESDREGTTLFKARIEVLFERLVD